MPHTNDVIIPIKLGIGLLEDEAGDIIVYGFAKVTMEQILDNDFNILATLEDINLV